MADYYSRYLELINLQDTSSVGVIGKMKCVFARWGIPFEVVTDNGHQLSSKDSKKFALDYNFTNNTSSPHFPQSKGKQRDMFR